MIDYNAFTEAMDGDEEMMSMIIDLYGAEHGEDIELITGLYASNNVEGLYQAVHSLKGVLLTLCEDNASQQLETIEQLCKQGQLPGRDLIDNVLAEVANVNSQVESLSLAN
ncbi:Hpt domain-containing protein [Photobacterium sp. DNB22_13_2]